MIVYVKEQRKDSETITGAPMFNTALKEHVFTGSKEVCCPLGNVCHSGVIRLTCISLVADVMNGSNNPWRPHNAGVGLEIKI